MEKQKIVSREDLDWLIYGNENDQIIAKLINEGNILKNVINAMLKASPHLINEHLALMLINYDSLLHSKTITVDQLIRLRLLDKKYNLVDNYKIKFGH